MDYSLVPIPLINLIRSYDVTEFPLTSQTVVIVVLGNIQFRDPQSMHLLTGTLEQPGLYDSNFAFGFRDGKKPLTMTDEEIELELPDYDARMAVMAGKVYCHQFTVVSKNPTRLRMNDLSLITPWNPKNGFEQGTTPWMVEQFAGGYGGWSFAKQFLTPFVSEAWRTIAIEHSLPHAVQFALTHGMSIVNDLDGLPADFLMRSMEDVIFCADIAEIKCLRLKQWLPINIWCASSPCQSWSHAGLQAGFGHTNGMCLATSICQVRIFKPPVFLLEQVKGFADHPQFEIAMRLILWAGYRPLIHQVFDYGTIGPIRRQRWLGVFIHEDHWHEHAVSFSWPDTPRLLPSGFDFRFHLSHHETSKMTPDDQSMEKYFASEYMPGKLRTWTRSEILAYRVPSFNTVLPTVMSAYGNQHNLMPYHLQTKGLFGFFIRQGASVRFLAPYEIAFLHAQTAALILLKPIRTSWETVGNMICIPHAVFALMHAVYYLRRGDIKLNPTEAVQLVIHQRLKASQTALTQDVFAWYIGSNAEAEALQTRLRFYIAQLSWSNDASTNHWPKGFYFSPTHGLLPNDQSELQLPEMPNTASISPTLKFALFFHVMLFVVPGEYGTFQVEGNVTWHALLAFWNFAFLPTEFTITPQLLKTALCDSLTQDQILLYPQSVVTLPSDLQNHDLTSVWPIAIRSDIDLTIYEIQEETKWKDTSFKLNHPSITFHDPFGDLLDDMDFPNSSTVIARVIDHCSDPPTSILDFFRLFPCVQDIHLENYVPVNTDILVISAHGPAHRFAAFFQFWAPVTDTNWLARQGRQCCFQQVEPDHWLLIFRPCLPTSATPAHVLKWNIILKMIRCIGYSLSCQTDSEVIMRLKYKGRNLFEHPFPAQATLGPILAAFQHVFQLISFGDQPALVAYGRRCTETCQFIDLQSRMAFTDNPNKSNVVVCHLIEPFSGGARTPGSKQEFEHTVEAGVANLLLEHGLSLPQVTSAAPKLLKECGLARLHHLLHKETINERYSKFEQICKDLGIQLPHGPKLSTADHKYRKLHQNRPLNPEDFAKYCLVDGYFCNEDGTPATVLTQFSSQTSGICMLTAEQAIGWLDHTYDLTPDELAIFILGPVQIPPRFEATQVQAPAKDERAREVVLNGTLVQMGEKHIQLPTVENTIAPKQVQVAAITLWKQDHPPELWSRILETPVKAAKDLLALDGFNGLIGKPWGRTYMDDKQVVAPFLCTSVQFHTEIDTSNQRYSALLKRSGFNGVFITPKSGHGKIDDKWKAIWVTGTPQQLEPKAAALTGSAGLIRGSKSYAIRVESGAFSSAWVKLRPGIDPPEQSTHKHLFRVQPFPMGTDKAVIQQWSEQCKWPVRAIKSIGAKQWLLGSNELPPSLLTFNGHPLLVKLVHQPGDPQTQIIAAGPKPPTKAMHKKPENPHKYDTSHGVFRSGDPFLDAWKNWQPSKADSDSFPSGAPKTATDRVSGPSGDGRPTPSFAATYVAPADHRSATGPVAGRLQQQDDRIHAIETLVAEIQHEQKQVKTQMDTKFHQVDQQIQAQIQETRTGFQHMQQEHTSLQGSIAHALQKQEEKMATSFDELKSLFRSARGQKRNIEHPEDEELEDW